MKSGTGTFGEMTLLCGDVLRAMRYLDAERKAGTAAGIAQMFYGVRLAESRVVPKDTCHLVDQDLATLQTFKIPDTAVTH